MSPKGKWNSKIKFGKSRLVWVARQGWWNVIICTHIIYTHAYFNMNIFFRCVALLHDLMRHVEDLSSWKQTCFWYLGSQSLSFSMIWFANNHGIILHNHALNASLLQSMTHVIYVLVPAWLWSSSSSTDFRGKSSNGYHPHLHNDFSSYLSSMISIPPRNLRYQKKAIWMFPKIMVPPNHQS